MPDNLILYSNPKENKKESYMCFGRICEPLILEPEDWSENEWKTILKLFGLQSAKRVVISNFKQEAWGSLDPNAKIAYKSNDSKLDPRIRRQVIIKTQTPEDEYSILEQMHNQLAGNQDYVDCRIVLNDSSARRDGSKNEVHLYIFNDSNSDPDMVISRKTSKETTSDE